MTGAMNPYIRTLALEMSQSLQNLKQIEIETIDTAIVHATTGLEEQIANTIALAKEEGCPFNPRDFFDDVVLRMYDEHIEQTRDELFPDLMTIANNVPTRLKEQT